MDTDYEDSDYEDSPTRNNTPDPDYVPESRPMGDLGIHVLVGKLRRCPEPSHAGYGVAAQYDALWAFVPIDSATLSYDAFNAAVSTSANALISQQDEDALTVFHPIGKYIAYHVTLSRANANPGRQGEFIPPPTSLMTIPSTRTNDRRKPVWVEINVHSTHPPPAARTFHTDELMRVLRHLDKNLGDGPRGRNTLRLGEIPGWAPNAGDEVTISREDWAIAVETSLLLLELNGPSELLQNAVTYCRSVGSPSVLQRSFEDLLNYLAHNMYFNYLDGDVIDNVVSWITRRNHITRPPLRVDPGPGFWSLMQQFMVDRIERIADRERALAAQDAARGEWLPGVEQFPRF